MAKKIVEPYSRVLSLPSALIIILGKPIDWRISDFSKPELYKPLLILIDNYRLQADKIYCPNPSTFTATLADMNDFKIHDIDNHRIFYGPMADGMLIPSGATLRLTSADCATIVVTHKKTNMVIAAHAGRNCLIDLKHIIGEREGQERENIVKAIMKKIRRAYITDLDLTKLRVNIFCSISGQNFHHPPEHPVHGPTNRILISYLYNRYPGWEIIRDKANGGIDIPTIIRAEFEKHGVPGDCISHDGIDTFAHGGLWSRRRGESGSNLILIHRFK